MPTWPAPGAGHQVERLGLSNPRSSGLPGALHLSQDAGGVVGLLLAGLRPEHGDQACHVGVGEAGVEAHGEVGCQLGVDAVQAGQSGDGGDFPAREIEVVAPEDVAEQVALEELVDGRGECEVLAGRGAPIRRVWFAAPSSTLLLPSGSGLASLPISSLMPRASRSFRTAMNVVMALRLRGNPA